MNNQPTRYFALRGIAAFSIAAGLALPAVAQSTGNPKGSVPPPASDSQKAPASRSPNAGFGESGKIVTDQETVKSRSQTTNPSTDAAPPRSTAGRSAAPSGSGSGARTGARGPDPSAKPVPQ